MDARRQGDDTLKVLEEKDYYQDFKIQQSHSSKAKKKALQINNNGENSLLADLSYRKYCRESSDQSERH